VLPGVTLPGVTLRGPDLSVIVIIGAPNDIILSKVGLGGVPPRFRRSSAQIPPRKTCRTLVLVQNQSPATIVKVRRNLGGTPPRPLAETDRFKIRGP